MKMIIRLLCLFVLIQTVSCTKEDAIDAKRDSAMHTVRDLEKLGLSYFAFNSDNKSSVKEGFGVNISECKEDLKYTVDIAMKNNDLIYGIRTITGDYSYSPMKYFAKNDLENAMKYAIDNKADFIINLEDGTLIEAGENDGLFEDKFIVNQEVKAGVVKIKCMPERYYLVEINMKNDPYLWDVGENYGKCIKKLPIMYAERIGSYLAGSMVVEGIWPQDAAARVLAVSLNMTWADDIMLRGMGCGFAGWRAQDAGTVMFYTLNLLADALRPTACSAFGVMPQMSATGQTMAYRTLDWPDANIDVFPFNKWPLNKVITKDRTGLVSPLQAITKIIYKDKTIYSFGLLGVISGITSIDQTNSNMVAILDSSTGDSYSAWGKNSYVFDLANSIRKKNTIDEIANDMKSPSYTFNHILLMANKDKVGFLENNINLKGSPNNTGVREMRYWNSASNGVLPKWEKDYLIGSVNCFQLKGQVDNSKVNPDLCNAARWNQMQNKVKEILERPQSGGKLTSDDLWEIQTTYSGTLDKNKFDNLYNYNTQQMIQYIPATNTVRVYMKPFDGKPVAKPTSFTITLDR